MPGEWLTAYQTQQLVADRRNAWDRSAIEELQFAIIDNARTILPARCQYMWNKILHDTSPDTKAEERDVFVPTWVWNLTSHMKLDWRTGIFHLAGDHEGNLRYVKLVGIEFEVAAIQRIWPDIAVSAAPIPEDTILIKARGGAQPKLEVWHSFWFEAMKMLHNGELHDADRFPSQRALRDELLSRSKEALSDESVKPLISRIWHEFRQV